MISTKFSAAVRHWRSDWHFFFFFNDTATTEIYTLSLHDALPILERSSKRRRFTSLLSAPASSRRMAQAKTCLSVLLWRDRKSTRLNSSHLGNSYAVFCL